MKIRKLYVIEKANALKVANEKKRLRKEAKGYDTQKITESSIIDKLIKKGLQAVE